MWVAHMFRFSKVQCLLYNGAMDDILFHGRQVIGEEGDKFHCQVGYAPEGLGAQSFVKKRDSHALILFGNLNVDGTYNLTLGLCKGGGSGGSCSRKGGSLGGFVVANPDVLELESEGNGGAIWVESAHKSLQKFCEVAEVHVLM